MCAVCAGKKVEPRLYPENALEAAFVDGIMDSQEDVLNAFVHQFFVVQDAEAKKAGAKKLIEEAFPFWFGRFEARLAENVKRGNDAGYFVGAALSIADLKSYTNFCMFRSALADAGIAELLAKYEGITKFLGVMDKDEKIKAALAAYQANYAAFDGGKGKTLFKHAGKYLSLA